MNESATSRALSNVEFALLQLISEQGELSGYEINKLVEQRGYREWADIGETSIYSGLDKLNKRGYVDYYIDSAKQGRGPLPKKFTLTGSGTQALKEATLEALSSTRERDRRFDLALASLPVVAPMDAAGSLKRRKRFLKDESARIVATFEAQGGTGLPAHVQALFKHPLVLIRAELKFIDDIIDSLT